MLPWYRLVASRKIVVVADVVAPRELVFIVSLKHVPTYVTVAKRAMYLMLSSASVLHLFILMRYNLLLMVFLFSGGKWKQENCVWVMKTIPHSDMKR